MSRWFCWTMLILVLAVLPSLTLSLATANNNTLSDKETSEGWELAFDGETFDGWQGMKGTSFPSQSWTIRDGMICTQNDRSGGDIVSTEKYDDFMFELEWKISPQGNSGIKYLVQQEWLNPGFQPDYDDDRKRRPWRSAVGCEFPILDDSRLEEGREEKTSTGALYLLYAPKNKQINPPGEWNHTRIIVLGNRVEHWLNGGKLLEYELNSSELMERVEETKFHKVPGYGIKAAGHLSLQHHGAPACFRNLKIRRIPGR